MNHFPDLRNCLDSWSYDPDKNVTLARVANGREIILVRQRMGLEQYEVEGRPDGQRPHGMESAFEFQVARAVAARQVGGEKRFQLTAEDCAELFDEGTIYYHRLLHFFQLKDWLHAERAAVGNLRLLDFVKRYAEHVEDRAQLEQWRPDLTRMNAIARAMIFLSKGEYDEALKIARESIAGIERVDRDLKSARELADALLRELRRALTTRPKLRPREESVFRREGDYWTISYQGQTAHLKATRGLHDLVCLLRHPGREFHVSQLLAHDVEVPISVTVNAVRNNHRDFSLSVATPHSSDVGPILDARAKAEYKRRVEELRSDLEEAERFNDSERSVRDQEELDVIVQQIASAVGLGGKDRRSGSEAERARSTVTKRIKETIHRIAACIAALGLHLDARVKTGYFCSYNPHPDHPVAWKF